MRSLAKHVRGFAIVSAIFILVVLAALGAFIVNVSTTQQIGSALDVQGVRAYQAARAGVEWGLYQVQATPAYNFGYTSPDPNTRACPAATTSFTPAGATFTGITVTVTCAATVDASSGPTIYAIVATACNQPVAGWTAATLACPNTTNPGALYIERRLSVTF
ncbi:MAG: pilus assembly PilX N-terminal domain-containing protein [Burkholderiaceae bacterium]|nr:pilus assembly PilX N-terminal domain-containing protein [Sulfuritalea sp.]MCF8174667.1 pilus assembly PilX N-terminal domain-containing protein [Burkholderiaceae bacterium]